MSSSFKIPVCKDRVVHGAQHGFLEFFDNFAQRDHAQVLERLFPRYFQSPFEMSGYFPLLLSELRGYSLSYFLHLFFRVQLGRGSVKNHDELFALKLVSVAKEPNEELVFQVYAFLFIAHNSSLIPFTLSKRRLIFTMSRGVLLHQIGVLLINVVPAVCQLRRDDEFLHISIVADEP